MCLVIIYLTRTGIFWCSLRHLQIRSRILSVLRLYCVIQLMSRIRQNFHFWPLKKVVFTLLLVSAYCNTLEEMINEKIEAFLALRDKARNFKDSLMDEDAKSRLLTRRNQIAKIQNRTKIARNSNLKIIIQLTKANYSNCIIKFSSQDNFSFTNYFIKSVHEFRSMVAFSSPKTQITRRRL